MEVEENGLSAPLDFSTTSPSSSSEDQQMVNLSERLLPTAGSPPNSYPADANRKYPAKADYPSKVTVSTFASKEHDNIARSSFSLARSDLCSRRRTAQGATTL